PRLTVSGKARNRNLTRSNVGERYMKKNIRDACEQFLEAWDRQEWMQVHGEWASAQWEGERAEYRARAEALEGALEEALTALRARSADDLRDGVPDIDLTGIQETYQELAKAAEALSYQVRPDESDYIAEGMIDPDGVASNAKDLDVGDRWQGWDCIEGWKAYRVGDALYVC